MSSMRPVIRREVLIGVDEDPALRHSLLKGLSTAAFSFSFVRVLVRLLVWLSFCGFA